MEKEKGILFTPKAEKFLSNLLETWPTITRNLWDKRVREICQIVAASKGKNIVSEDLIMEAMKLWPFENNRWRIFGNLAEKGLLKEGFASRRNLGYGGSPKVGSWSCSKQEENLNKKTEELKVIGIQSSPREKGNTDVLLSEILRGARDKGANVEKFDIARMNIEFCTGCEACRQEKKLPNFCVIKDDLTNGLYKKFIDADIYVIGFPIYTGRENAALCNFFDRFYGVEMGRMPWKWEDEEKKRAALVVTWGAPYPAFERTIENHGDLLMWYGIDVKEAIYGWGCHEKGEIAKDKEGLEMAYKAGQRLVS